jgi:hypothetical protein
MEENMDLYGINTGYQSTQTYATSSKQATNSTQTTNNKSSDTKKTNDAYSGAAAVYESSSASTNKTSSDTGTVKVKRDNSAIISQLKSDAETRMAQMQSLVTQMFQKQGKTIGTADNMWKMLANGNFTADADTIAQAKKDISEDGYWGVSQTSERIFSFAQALAGDDKEKMQSMVEAFKKGFSEATKSWGKSLPSISNDTYDAVIDKFNNWFDNQD